MAIDEPNGYKVARIALQSDLHVVFRNQYSHRFPIVIGERYLFLVPTHLSCIKRLDNVLKEGSDARSIPVEHQVKLGRLRAAFELGR